RRGPGLPGGVRRRAAGAPQADPLRGAALPLDLRGDLGGALGAAGERSAQALAAAREPRLLRRVLHRGSAALLSEAPGRRLARAPDRMVVPGAALVQHAPRLLRGSRDRRGPPPGQPAPLAAAEHRHEPRRARLLQVPRLLRGERPGALRLARADAGLGAAADLPALRHQLLHVPEPLLLDRGVPRPPAGGAELLEPGLLHRVLSAADRRPDRAGDGVPAADPHAAPPRRGRRARLRHALPGRLREEDLRRRRRRLPGRRLLPRAPAVRCLERLGGGALLRGPDLLRLQRLHGHGDRGGARARLRALPELRLPVPEPERVGVLAALAHESLLLAARLPLHPARREPWVAALHLAEPDAHHAAGRTLARCGVDLRGLGWSARHRAGGPPGVGAVAGGRPGPPGRARRPAHLPLRGARLGAVPRGRRLRRGGFGEAAPRPGRRLLPRAWPAPPLRGGKPGA